ncbi:MAG: vWA domain-containing protein [Hyphomicrobiales bacterium]
MLILDASGSMWGQVEGKPKYRIARSVIGDVLKDIGKKVNMGVMAYGHRTKGDCKDIQTLIPVGPVSSNRYMSAINKIKPKGKTPISAAVRKAAEALKYTEEKATIVLVSDGLETCNADPCALSAELEKLGIDFTVHVVGFDLGNEDTSTLSCLAKNTGGLFLSAQNANELSEAIGQVVEAVRGPAVAEVKPAPEPEPAPQPEPEPVAGPTQVLPRAYLVAGGERLTDAYYRVYGIEQDADGKRKQLTTGGGKPKFKLKPGRYYITAERGSARTGTEVEVVEGEATILDIVLNAGLLRTTASLAPEGEQLGDAYFRVYEAKQDIDGNRKRVVTGGGKPKFTLTAGSYYITANRGSALTGVDVVVEAGGADKVHIVLNAGIAIPSAAFNEGGEPIKNAYFRVYESKQDDDGKRKRVTTGGGKPKFTVPAGEYYLTAEVGDASIGTNIAIAPGEATRVALVLGAGVLAPTAYYSEGGDPVKGAYFRVYKAQQNADGQRKQVTAGGGKPKFKLPASKYYVTAEIGDAVIGKDVEIKAGEAVDVAMVLGAGIVVPTAHYAEGSDSVKGVYFRVFAAEQNADGQRKQIAAGGGKPKFKLPSGKYWITAKIGDALVGRDIEVRAGERTDVAVVLDAGVLALFASASQGGDPVKKVYFRVYDLKKDIEGNRKQLTAGGGAPKFKLPAGKYLATAKWGDATARMEVEVTAGQMTETTINLNAGRLEVVAVDAASGQRRTDRPSFRVYSAKKDIEGNRKQIAAGSGETFAANVPAGKYVVSARIRGDKKASGSVEIEVKSGELTEAQVPVEAD